MGPPPVVTGISPKEGPPGTRVTIRGEFLGTSATDFIGLKICGCDCLLSAEWKSKNKIVARSGPCKGRGDIIVTTKSGGEGTSTVQFRGYHESVGPMKESAVWVEESAPPTLPWGRRPMSPTVYTPPDPLGLSTEGDDIKFPEEELHELFPDGSGKLSDENFNPCWYLLENHSNTSFEDLKAGAVFLQRKVEGQKEGQLSYLKANIGAVMDQLDRLVLIKNMFDEDVRRNGKEPLPGLHSAIEESINRADSLFSEILSRKEKADKTREALTLLTRHKFLFQLPSSIDKNIKRKEYDLVVNDYTRVKNLFGNTDVQLFQKILAEIDKKIEDFKEKLHTKIKKMPISIQEQKKLIRLLISLSWEGDSAWDAINSRKDYLISLLNKLKDHFKLKEEQENDKSKRRSSSTENFGEWSWSRELWCGAACTVLSGELSALWTFGRWYFGGELAGQATAPLRQDEFKLMIISAMELFAEQMRGCLLTGNGSAEPDAVRLRLMANLRHLREAHDLLFKLDLPSQPLSIVEKVILDYRVHGMTTFLQRALKRVKSLPEEETWKIEEYTDYGAITKLPGLVERCMAECLSQCAEATGAGPGPGPGAGAGPGAKGKGDANERLQRCTRQVLLAAVAALRHCALEHSDEEWSNNSLSVALDQKLDESATCPADGTPSWQQRLLVAATNVHYTKNVTLNNIAALFERYSFPKPTEALEATKEALTALESTIVETYLEHKGDPLVGTIEPSMYMGKHGLEPDAYVDDARPYVYEIINNLIAVHAEVDAACGPRGGRFLRDICETVCEEVARLAAAAAPRAFPLRARLEVALLRLAVASHLTAKAENYLVEALSGVPPLEGDDIKKMETIVKNFKKRMELQLACLNCNTETV